VACAIFMDNCCLCEVECVGAIFYPCRHHVVCYGCSQRVTRCPSCKVGIDIYPYNLTFVSTFSFSFSWQVKIGNYNYNIVFFQENVVARIKFPVAKTCVFCNSNMVDTIFLPCFHMKTCQGIMTIIMITILFIIYTAYNIQLTIKQ
jgi:hypothetical protein